MIRIEYLKVQNHPQLGDFDIWLSEPEEVKDVSKPYTSVIIGPNGTGKSYILRTIAEILRQFKNYSDTDEKKFNIPFDLHLRYKFYHNTYEIVTKHLKMINKSTRKRYLFFKNRPFENRFWDEENETEIITNYEVLYRELEFPEKLLVNSIIPTDRFVWQDSKPGDFYQYLGSRSTRSTSSTKSTSRRTVKHLFNATALNDSFKETLKELLEFLDFENSFKVHYTTKVNKLFFTGELTESNFKQYFENWWDEDFKYTTRKKENPLWSIPYYNKNFRGKVSEIGRIVDYLNDISKQENKLLHKKNSSAKIISVDLFDKDITESELSLISHLENLDIINLDGIKINKSDSTLSIDQISSGEYHLLISLIGIFANISKESLVLIDEPEISLHPNWQMRYISFLKKVFSKFGSCQFVLTTHSHFLISDLENKSSCVTILNREGETNILRATLLSKTDTYGWAAEDVLYKIFEVRTTRNYYTEIDMRELLHLISENEKNKPKLEAIKLRLEKVKVSEDDPLNLILIKVQDYIDSL